MKINSLIKLIFMLMAFSFVGRAYCQSYSIEVGETLTLNVPSVSTGYVDKAIWACSNSAISFVSKSNQNAVITALQPFEGYATIELVYVEKYVDDKGFTRANTYTKNYHVYCKTSDGGSSTVATSIFVEPEIKVAIGEKAKIYYHVYPEGSTAQLYTSSSPGKYFKGLILHKDGGYVEGIARSAGVEDVSVYFYNEKEERVSTTCKVTVYDPTWLEPTSVSLPNVLLVTVGETKKLLPLFTPSSATALCGWSSDNSSVAYISDGNIKAKNPGTANVTLKTSNGLMSQCTVIVLQDKMQIPGLSKALDRVSDLLKSAENENVK